MTNNQAGKGPNPRPFSSYKTYLSNFDNIDWTDAAEETTFEDNAHLESINGEIVRDPMLNVKNEKGAECYNEETGSK